MTTTFTGARDDILGRLNDQWTEVGAVTENLPILFEDKEESQTDVPETESAWGRAGVRFLTASQVAHGDNEKLYRRPGVLVVDVFTPPGDGLTLLDSIVAVIAAAFEGHTTPGGVTFSDFDQDDLGISERDRQTRVTVLFEFHERK